MRKRFRAGLLSPRRCTVWASLGVIVFGSAPAGATNHILQMNEVCAGVNGDSNIQFLEMKFPVGQNLWGPQAGETQARAMLRFFDARGFQTATFNFPNNVTQSGPLENGLHSALIATQAFADFTGVAPDFLLPDNFIHPIAGKVCFTHNPLNPVSSSVFRVEHCLSWGTDHPNPADLTACPHPFENGFTDYVGPCCTQFCAGGGPISVAHVIPATHCVVGCGILGATPPLDGREGPHNQPLPIVDVHSIVRVANLGTIAQPTCNRDFNFTSAPTPRREDGTIANLGVPASEAVQGQNIFFKESFLGNGRFCSTCHLPQDGFGLNPSTVASLPLTDPLFVADPASPNFIPGILDLENACLMKNSGRALIKEPIHGFTNMQVFRPSPHLMNIELTAPYGMSPTFGGAPDLEGFCQGAVKVHFPKLLPRNFNPAFGPLSQRTGTTETMGDPDRGELDFMEVFQNTIRTTGVVPGNQTTTLDNLILAKVACGGNQNNIDDGRDLFDGTAGTAFCTACHVGVVLDGSILELQTGVVDLPANDDDGCSGTPDDPFPALPSEDAACAGDPGNGPPCPSVACSAPMPFGVPPLVDIARVKERFFHGGEAATLRESVAFYISPQFRCSPQGTGFGCDPPSLEPGCPDAHSGNNCALQMSDTGPNNDVDLITEFLQALVEPCVARCCLTNSCVDVNIFECNALGGTFEFPLTCSTPCGVPPGGACCLPDGSCVGNQTQAQCDALCGTFAGSGTQCASQQCPISLFGACCLANDTCVSTQGECLCEQQGGEFQGPGTNCAYVSCPDTGSCCLPEGGCVVVTESECDAQCGEFFGVGSSCPFVCLPLPEGACCLPDGTCQITNGECRCLQLGGEFRGDGSACTGPYAVQCEIPGACCLPDVTCDILVESECEARCGIFQGEETVCGDECCLELDHACCLPNGDCLDVITCECVRLGGESQPAGRSCGDPGVCATGGACCLPDGTCRILTKVVCDGECGIFQGEGSSCGFPANQMQNTHAVMLLLECPVEIGRPCCLPSGDCIVTNSCLCAQQGGTSQNGFSCDDVACPVPLGRCCSLNGACTMTTEGACAASCGFFTPGGNCSQQCPIVDAQVACCLPDGTCQVVAGGDCVCIQQGGTPQGAFFCDGIVCPAPTGRCCLNNGTCTVTTKAACLANCGATFGGNFTTCSGALCPAALPGACCFGTTCKQRTPCACAAEGGVFRGGACGPNTCRIILPPSDPVDEFELEQ